MHLQCATVALAQSQIEGVGECFHQHSAAIVAEGQVTSTGSSELGRLESDVGRRN
ncbi:hypothetical protein JNK13_04905 [bacterium]|nr:hypothetical protein [bacterium]